MSARSGRINVRTITPGAPFLPTLVRACMDGGLGVRFDAGSRDYSEAVIYVPTRRAARALAHAFADAVKPRTVLLPRIIPLGDPMDLEERAILTGGEAAADIDTPPAIGELDRRLLLNSLIEQWRKSRDLVDLQASGDGFSIGGGFADSFALSADLAALIDEFAIEGADWSKVGSLAPEQFDQYWSLTRDFLAIAGRAWPEVLAELGLLDPAERRNRLLRAEADRLKTHPPAHPVIAAGSTGTVPATAALLSAIARLPNGAVVLPGLDLAMDPRSWDLIADQTATGGEEVQPGHPQAALKRLLGRLGIERESVDEIGTADAPLAVRTQILHAAARPASATDNWPELRQSLAGPAAEALSCVSVIEAPDERLEALAIAVALREVLETEGRTAALVTPDRALARRVSTELCRWGVLADDSAGTPLADSPLGSFARLLSEVVLQDFSATAAMAIAAHPCLSIGSLEAIQALEIAGMRGVDAAIGINGLAARLDGAEDRMNDFRASIPLKRIRADALAEARKLLGALVDALAPLSAIAGELHPLHEIASAHQTAIDRLAGERAASGADALALAKVFDRIASTNITPALAFGDYAALFETLLAEEIIAPAQPVQGRIKIWGLLEARLMDAHRVVLGGLNETIWPPETRSDPFLNRAMRAELGLPPPERRIGQSAHDFAQAMAAPEAIIARARTVEGTPMVASRFLRRLEAFVGADAAKEMRDRGNRYIDAAVALDDAPPVPSAPRPNPKPEAAKQPKSLSVTEIRTLMRDPYAIYARHVLGLQPLDPLEATVDARDRGNIIHKALAAFIATSQTAWPADPLATLIAIGKDEFAPYAHIESVSAFWWPVFERVAAWFVDWEEGRRAGIASSAVETIGSLTFPLADGTSFRLRARADRIDRLRDGSLMILDYKTGTPSSGKQIALGLDPQLTLMAYMASQGQFENVLAGPVGAVAYVKLASESQEIIPKIDRNPMTSDDVERLMMHHIGKLKEVLDRLRSNQQGFLSRQRIEKEGDSGDYDHLARVREWSGE